MTDTTDLMKMIEECIINKTDDITDLKKSINKIIDVYYKQKKEPSEYNKFVKEQMLLLKDAKDIPNKMAYVRILWKNKKQEEYELKYPNSNGFKGHSRGYRLAL